MASTTFSGPVTSTNGFVGTIVSTLVTAANANITTVNATTVNAVTTLVGTGLNNIIVIPTVDPQYPGAIWNNAGTLSISTG